jgi:hypothetical protein
MITAKVNNLPKSLRNGFMVARRATDGQLWYYGIYGSEKRARNVAEEIGNGLVLMVDGEEETAEPRY